MVIDDDVVGGAILHDDAERKAPPPISFLDVVVDDLGMRSSAKQLDADRNITAERRLDFRLQFCRDVIALRIGIGPLDADRALEISREVVVRNYHGIGTHRICLRVDEHTLIAATRIGI